MQLAQDGKDAVGPGRALQAERAACTRIQGMREARMLPQSQQYVQHALNNINNQKYAENFKANIKVFKGK